jgi:hypothetical protein
MFDDADTGSQGRPRHQLTGLGDRCILMRDLARPVVYHPRRLTNADNEIAVLVAMLAKARSIKPGIM